MKSPKKKLDILRLINGLLLLLLLNGIAGLFFFRIDLTEEKRYTIKEPTRELLRGLEDDVYVEVYLTGDLNPGFLRFQKSIRETLEEFSIYSGRKVKFQFVDPAQAASRQAQAEYMRELASKGIRPTNVIDNKNGQKIEKILFPGAVVSFGGDEVGVMLLKGNKARTSEEEINQSIEGVEFELANAIYKLTTLNRKRVGFVRGHGELDSLNRIAFTEAAREVYDVFDITMADSLAKFDALVIAKPVKPFSPLERFKLDQYVMRGGKLLLLMDKLEASMDSASLPDYFAFPYETGLDDQLFRYGVRVNMNLVQDKSSGSYPVITGNSGGQPKIQLIDWPFFPLVNQYADHPITRNLDAVVVRFGSTIDTVKAEGIKKTPLMFSSDYSRVITAPVNISIQEVRRNLGNDQAYDSRRVPMAYLLEGEFTSAFKNRFPPEGVDRNSVIGKGVRTKMIVVADGDLARNEVNPRTGEPQPLGFDPFTNYTFASKDLLINMLSFLMDEDGLIRARSKEVRIRPLDKQKIAEEKLYWQLLNTAVPLVLLVAFGLVRAVLRKRKYASFS